MSKLELFEQTSQFIHWRFTKDELVRLRTANNKQGVVRVLESLRKEQQVTGTASTLEAEATENLLTPEEELQLIDYYLQMIKTYAKIYQGYKLLSPEALNYVKSTAINFMKRFYLHNVVFDYPPKSIMLTCFYLATKVENAFMKIEDFLRPIVAAEKKRGGNRALTKSSDILDLEFVVIQSLQFELAVHHPYRSAYGFYLDMQESLSEDRLLLKETYDRTQHFIEQSLYTDLVFIYQPSQIALGAFKLAAKEKELDADAYLTQRFDAKSLELLYPILDDIQDTIAAFKNTLQKKAQEIDRKLILCRNPEKNPNSKLYQQQKEDSQGVPYPSSSDSEGDD